MADTLARLSAVAAARGMVQTLVSYPAPAAIAGRHGLDGDLADALASIDAVIRAVIDR